MQGMAAQKQVVVVGAGIIGASIAWHLTAAGARVTVVDAMGGGGVATPNSFAWINASWGNPEQYFRLRIRAMAEWRRLAADVPIPLAWNGGLCFDLPPAELEAYAREHGSWGYGIRRVDRVEAQRIEPGLADPPEFALHIAE
jgi:glycine/D-amino acid oxidase-like deaminating enzyme